MATLGLKLHLITTFEIFERVQQIFLMQKLDLFWLLREYAKQCFHKRQLIITCDTTQFSMISLPQSPERDECV